MDHRRASTPGDVQFGELPELTRGLRAMGSPRHSGSHGTASATPPMHTRFFAPLLEARRRAAESPSPQAAVQAFDTRGLAEELDRTIERIVAEWPDERTPARRALRTGLRERAEEYARALEELRVRAVHLTSAAEDARLQAWRDWTAQLVATFHAADRSWIALRSVIERLPSRDAT